MNLRHLEVFCSVVRCESFSGAAEQLFMTQPAVSMQVQAVERYFGVQLLERRSRRVTLTETGHVVHGWACEVLRLESETRRLVDELKRAETGRIVVGTSMGLGSHILPQIIHQFKRDHPSAEIVVRLADREEVFQEILAGAIDAGVLIAAEVPPGLEIEIVGTEEIVLICAPTHPLAGRSQTTVGELAEESFVMPPKGSGFRRVIDQVLAIQGLDEVSIHMEVGVQEGVKRAVEQGVGVGLMLRSAVAFEFERGWLCEIPAPRGQPTVELALARRPHQQASPLLQAFIEALRTGLRDQWWRGIPDDRKGKGDGSNRGPAGRPAHSLPNSG